MSQARRSFVGAAVALLAATASAQAPEPKPQPPVRIAPVGTERVQVAVVVTDRNGRPVTGLEPADFRLLEDGKPQIVTHFVGPLQPEDEDEDELVAPAMSGIPRAASPAGGRGGGRHMVLVVDDLHLSYE